MIYRRNERQEKSGTEACSGKEIAGLLKKKMMMVMIMMKKKKKRKDDTKIVKSRVSGFSHGKLEAGRNELG